MLVTAAILVVCLLLVAATAVEFRRPVPYRLLRRPQDAPLNDE